MTDELGLWLTIFACGAVTYMMRLSLIAAQGRLTTPPWLQRALTFVPVAVLSALTLPELLLHDQALNLSVGNARLWAGLLAALVAWRTGNVWTTVGVGMMVLWGFSLVIQ